MNETMTVLKFAAAFCAVLTLFATYFCLAFKSKAEDCDEKEAGIDADDDVGYDDAGYDDAGGDVDEDADEVIDLNGVDHDEDASNGKTQQLDELLSEFI